MSQIESGNDWKDLVDLDRLEAWMNDQGLEAGPIKDIRVLGGGTQNLLLRFRRGTKEFVLRRPPANPLMDGNLTMRREAALLRGLSQTGVPHPRLVEACLDEEVLGAAFYLMEPVEGFLANGQLPALHASDARIRQHMGFALVDGIAALGAVDYVAAGLSDLGKADGYLDRQTSRWWRQLEGYSAFSGWPGTNGLPGAEPVARWLESNRPKTFIPGVMHGDYHFGNVLFKHDSPELAAIVDWELATIGDPLIDLGWLLAIWPAEDNPVALATHPWLGFPTADELVARYADRSSRDTSSIAWYRVFACYKLAIIVEGTYARACAGLAGKSVGDELHGYALKLFQRARAWISQ